MIKKRRPPRIFFGWWTVLTSGLLSFWGQAPIYFGWTYDTTDSYISAFTVAAAVLAVAGVLAALILPPKPPTQITDIHKFV